MRFLERIKQSEVFSTKTQRWTFYALGASMFITTAVFYYLLAKEYEDYYAEISPGHSGNPSGRLVKLLYVIFGIHLLVGILVAIDAGYFSGKSVALQTLIIGSGSFNTIVQGGVFLTTIVRDDYPFALVWWSTTSFILACLSNSLMLALLFAIFHAAFKKSIMLEKKASLASLSQNSRSKTMLTF